MNTNDCWRVVFSLPADGAFNMALDEALLEAAAQGHVLPTLRFFAWEPPTLSLGYAQAHTDANLEALNQLGWGLVRRPTGGRAILHTDELTYSIAAPDSHPILQGGVLESYRRLSRGLLAGLRVLGVTASANMERPVLRGAGAVCFETPSQYEITAGGRKLIGSAQARKAGGVLQHGTLPLTGDLARILKVLKTQKTAEQVRARAATLAEVLGRETAWRDAAEAMRNGFSEEFGIHFEEQEPTPAEILRSSVLVKEKYASDAWVRRIGYRWRNP